MTKVQRTSRIKNEANRCAKIAGLSYSKFVKVANKVSKRYPHETMQDIAEHIDCLYINGNLSNYNADEVASFVCDLLEAVS